MAERFTAQERPGDFITAWLSDGLDVMRQTKPNDRSPQDRAWAVTITDMEHVLAYWEMYGNPGGLERIGEAVPIKRAYELLKGEGDEQPTV